MKILLLVDMQKEFLKKDFMLEIQTKIQSLIEGNYFDKVIATVFYNEVYSPYEEIIGWYGCKRLEDLEIPKEYLSYIDEIYYKKEYSSLTVEVLNNIKAIVNMGDLEMYIAGVDTDCCVLMTAVDLLERGIRPIVLKDYCFSSGGLKYHQAGLQCLTRLIGIEQLKVGLPE